MLNAISRIEPSTIQVSHQIVTLELNRVSQPAPLTPPSTTLASKFEHAAPPPLAKPLTNRVS